LFKQVLFEVEANNGLEEECSSIEK